MLIPCVSFDGTDGTGKTTLLSKTSEEYITLSIPIFYASGVVPMNPEERKHWFRSHSQTDAMRIYLMANKHRLRPILDYKQGYHYKFLDETCKKKLIVIDRGVWAVEAFTYAAFKTEGILTDKEIFRFIDKYFREGFIDEANMIIDLSVVLAGDPSEYLDIVLSRREYEQHEIDLIKYQAEYYCLRESPLKNILALSPIDDFSKKMKMVRNAIQKIEG